MAGDFRVPWGHAFRVERTRGPVWWAKYRLPDGRQVQKKLGPAWTERGRPPAGYLTKRHAEAWLRDVLDQARRGPLPGMVRTGAASSDAAAEYLHHIGHDRGRKPSTLRGYRSNVEVHLLPAFGAMPLEDVTTEKTETWIAGYDGSARSRNKLLIEIHGIVARARKVYGLSGNVAADVEEFQARPSGDIRVFSPEEVWALVRAAASEQDGASFLTAAFTGLRMRELLALRWRGVDFPGATIRVRASSYLGQLALPKSGKVRAVPMPPDVAAALARLGRREFSVGEDELVFVGETSSAALPRSAPHVRDADDRQGRHPAGAGVDGPRRHPDDDALPAFRAAPGGRCPGGRGIEGGGRAGGREFV